MRDASQTSAIRATPSTTMFAMRTRLAANASPNRGPPTAGRPPTTTSWRSGRRIASNAVGVERTFPFNGSRIDKVEVTRRGRVRRAKLYYLRGRTGRAARVKEARRTTGA